jgi:phage FluMu gp28-like protein
MNRDPLYSAIVNTASARAPAALLPYQQEWIDDDSPLKVSEKSRRTGLTWAEAADNVLIAALDPSDGGQNVYYIGYNMDMAIEYIEACGMWARVFNKAAGAVEEGEEIFRDEKDEEQRIKTYTIKFPSGRRIVALSSRPANLRGKQGVVVIDEAAFHDKLDELLKAAIALLIWGGKVRVISTHNGEGNAFNELITEIRAGKRAGSVHRIDFRTAVSEGLYERVCLRLKKDFTPEAEDLWIASVYKFYGDASAEELDVLPSSGAGAYLSRARSWRRKTR